MKDLCEDNQIKHDITIKHYNDLMIHLRNTVNRKEISENQNPNKILDIVEKLLNFNKQ